MHLRKPLLFTFAVTLGLLAATGVLAWTGPTSSPPSGNASAPLNVSNTAQSKVGGLILNTGGATNGLQVSGATILSGGSSTNWAPLNIGSNGTSINAAGSIYSYGPICTDNSSGTCTGTGGAVLNANGNITNSGTIVTTSPSGQYGISAYATNGPAIYGNSAGSYGLYGHSNTSWGGVITQDSGTLGLVVEKTDGSVYSELMSSGYGLLTNQPVQATAFYYSSDQRLKKNIAAIASSTALQDVLALQPVTFNWIDPTQPTTTQLGFIAQQVEKIVPELVTTNASTTMKAVDYARVTPLLVGAVQEQQAQIDAQQKEIDALVAEVAALKAGK